MANTRVIFEGVDNGLDALMQRYSRQQTDMARNMISSARQQTSDSREVVKIIEEQIKAMERKARLDVVQTRIAQRDLLDRGQISQGQHNINVTGARDEYDNEMLNARILRDILATLQTNAREQARNDISNANIVANQVREGDFNQSEDGDDQIQALRDALSNRQASTRSSNDNTDDEQNENGDHDNDDARPKQNGKKSDSQLVRNTYAAAQQTALSRNEFYAFASLTAFLPLVGQGVSQLLNKALSQAESYESARSSLNSYNVRGVNATGDQAYQYGVTMSQFMQQYAMTAIKAQGSTKNAEDIGETMLLAEKQLAISPSTTAQIVRNLRNDNDRDITDTIKSFVTSFSFGDDDIRKGDFAKLEEYISVANQLSQKQSMTLDKVDNSLNARVVGSFAKLGGTFNDPNALQSIISSIDGSLSRPSSPYAQAMQYTVLAKQNPSMSRFDLLEQQSKGIAAPGLMQGVMEMLSKSSQGNTDLMKEQVLAMFPSLSPSQVSRIVSGYNEGNLDLSFTDAQNSTNALSKVNRSGLVGNLQRNTAEIDNVFARQGDQIVQQLQQILNTFGGMSGALEGLLGLGVDLLGTVNSAITFLGGKPSPVTNKIIKKGQK